MNKEILNLISQTIFSFFQTLIIYIVQNFI